MKIVAIMGSPKGKGSGYTVVREIERHMNDLGEVEFEYIFLKDANLGMCKGCFSCVPQGEDRCPLQDDRATIEEKMLRADGLILSSPIYVYNVSWLMKNFIDRFMYTHHRPRFFRQKTMLVLNSNGVGWKQAFVALRQALGGASIVHELSVSTPAYPVKNERAVRRSKKAIQIGAEKLYKACLNRRLPQPGIKDYLIFRVFQGGFTEAKELVPACYQYYRGKTYYYEAKIGPVKKLIAAIALPLVGFVAKHLL
ncbi:MAG TPA: flavodoxin family protein [Methanocella sp.]|nr:flavodoxin family protein [Methanocella sp.]